MFGTACIITNQLCAPLRKRRSLEGQVRDGGHPTQIDACVLEFEGQQRTHLVLQPSLDCF